MKQLPPVIRIEREDMPIVRCLDLLGQLDQRIRNAPRPVPIALMDELAGIVRKFVLGMEDTQIAEAFSALVQFADPHSLTGEQLAPVFHHMLRGPQPLGEGRMNIALAHMCALFPGKRLPAAWLETMMRCAQDLSASMNADQLRDTTRHMFDGSCCLLADDERASHDGALLRLALQARVELPATPVGLVAWLERSAAQHTPEETAAQLLAMLDELGNVGPDMKANVMARLGAAVVLRRRELHLVEHRLAPVLAWTLKQPPDDCERALAGLAWGIGRLAVSRLGPTQLASMLCVIGQLSQGLDAPSRRALAGFMSQALRHLERPPLAGKRVEDAKAPGTSEAAGVAPGPVLAGLRLLLECGDVAPSPLHGHLADLGEAVAHSMGGTAIEPVALLELATGIDRSRIETRAAGVLLFGLVRACGGASIGEPQFAAVVEALCLTSELRGAALTCHFAGGIDSAGVRGRALPKPLSLRLLESILRLPLDVRLRMGQDTDGAHLPPPLLLGVNLVDGPLEALRASALAPGEQLELLEAACQVVGGLDDTVMAEQVTDCSLLASDDLDFAIEAAIRLVGHAGPLPGVDALRQLRAAFLAQALRDAPSTSKPRDGKRELVENNSAVTPSSSSVRLERIAMLYESARTPRDFLASEIWRMRSGPHAQALEPLIARLQALAREPSPAASTTTTSSSSS